MNKLDQRDYIQRLYQVADKASEKWQDQIRHWRDLYEFRHYTKAPLPGETQFQDPSYTNVIDLTVGVLLGNSLDWKALGWSTSPANDKNTSRVEKYLAGLLDMASEREQYSLVYETMLHFARDGSAVIYSVWDPEMARRYYRQLEKPHPSVPWLTIPEAVYEEPPILVQVIDPLKIRLLPGGPNRWSRIIREEELSVYDVEVLFGIVPQRYKGLSLDEKMTTKGKLLDFWEVIQTPGGLPDDLRGWYANQPHAIRNAVLFDDEILRPLRLMPGYTNLPYTVGFFKPVNRDVPESWGHSVIQPMETAVQMLEKAVNRRQRQIDMYSSLPIVSRTQNARPIQVDAGLGSHIALSLEEDIGFPIWHGSPPDVDKHMQFASQAAQESSFPKTMYGSGSDANSGYALSQLNDQSRIRLTQPQVHLELFWTTWARKIMSMTAEFGGAAPVRVYGRMRGRDFAEQVSGLELKDYKIKARVRPVFPNEEARKHAMSTQTADVLTKRTRMEKYLGIEQPDEELERRVQELIQEHPLMQELTIRLLLQEMAEEDGLTGTAAAAMLARLDREGLQGQPGRPAEPRNMEQLTGLASPTGQPTPQERGQVPYGQTPRDQIMGLAAPAPRMTE